MKFQGNFLAEICMRILKILLYLYSLAVILMAALRHNLQIRQHVPTECLEAKEGCSKDILTFLYV